MIFYLFLLLLCNASSLYSFSNRAVITRQCNTQTALLSSIFYDDSSETESGSLTSFNNAKKLKQREVDEEYNNGISELLKFSQLKADKLILESKISDVLNILKNTDYGANCPTTTCVKVNDFIDNVSIVENKIAPIDNELLFGNYKVSFSNNGNDQKGGPAAGGGFRNMKYIYKVDGLYQHVLRDGNSIQVINYVKGKLFHWFILSVMLKGKVEKLSEERKKDILSTYGNKMTKSAVKADFEPPRLALSYGDNVLLSLSVGPKSSVELDTTYVDEKIRVGKGARGSYFVFERLLPGTAEFYQSDKYKAALQKPFLQIRKIAYVTAAISTLFLVKKVNPIVNGIILIGSLLVANSKGGNFDY